MNPISLEKQIVKSTLEHTIHYSLKRKMDTGTYEERFHDDQIDCPQRLLKKLDTNYTKLAVSVYRTGLKAPRCVIVKLHNPPSPAVAL